MASKTNKPAGELHLFRNIRVGTFLERPNRFLLRCRLEGRSVMAFLPNPGRLRELLLPGCPIHLVQEPNNPQRKTRYTAVAVEREGQPIMLHTHKTNDVARHLIELNLVPGLKGARVIRPEVTVGKSRFDFLLTHAGRDLLLEVKSCTLVGRKVAMFPDAVTARGARHVRELADLAHEGTRTAVLFIVHWPHARVFMPDFHTDLVFSRTLLECRDRVKVIAVSAQWNPDLALMPASRALKIPWAVIDKEARDRGSYLLVLYLRSTRTLSIGKLGQVHFPKGYYIYVGSAMGGLTSRVQRHKRIRKKMHWHIDRLRPHVRFVDALEIRSSTPLECELAHAVETISDRSIPGFGCSDCSCQSHLFGMDTNPSDRKEFHDLLTSFRMDRLAGE